MNMMGLKHWIGNRGRLLVGVALVLAGACGKSTEQLDRVGQLWETYHEEPHTVLVVAHRGAHTEVPENSLASIDKAVEAGAHIVELDVRQTKDGVLVILHDRTLDRTTTGAGEVSEHTYEQLKSLRLLHDGQPTAHTIPTMEEAILHAKGRILVDIDFKVDGMQARFDAFDDFARLGAEDLIVFFCYDYTELPVLHAYNPRIKVMPRAYDLAQFEEIVQSGMTDIIHIDRSYYDPESISQLVAGKNIRIWANVLGAFDEKATQEGPGAYADFLDEMMHVNVIQTDHPALLGEALSQQESLRSTQLTQF